MKTKYCKAVHHMPPLCQLGRLSKYKVEHEKQYSLQLKVILTTRTHCFNATKTAYNEGLKGYVANQGIETRLLAFQNKHGVE